MDKINEHGHLNKRPDDSGKCLSGIDAEDCTATAMASSKLFDAAVKESVAACP